MKLTFTTYSYVLTYIMSALGIGSIILAGSMDPVFVVSICAIVFASIVMNIRDRTIIHRSLWNILAIALFCFFILDYMSISEDLVVAASRFLMVVLAFKLFELKRMRDHITVIALVFFQILAAAVSTISPLFFLIVSVFIFTAMISIIIFSLRRDFAEARRVFNEPELPRDILGPGFIASIVVLSLISITFTMAIFFVMPRMGMGFFQRKSLDTIKTTGFNDTVRLGALGPVKTDTTVVMRVELAQYGAGDERPNLPMYLRGTALDRYDGENWTRSTENRRLVRRDESGMIRVGRSGSTLFEQKILLEPLDTEVIFAASHPVLIMEGQGSRKLVNLWYDDAGSVYLPSAPFSTLEYTVWSESGPAWEEPGDVDPSYLDTSQLDAMPDGAGIRRLVDTITEGAGSAADKARALNDYLRDGPFTYTLDPAPPSDRAGGDPLSDFILYTREGYCEHFATSLAMMLRASGVPSRIVTGYVPGEWNSYGGYYIVRQQDAHSWVEAYIDGQGWVTLDPTPPSGTAPVYRPSAMMLYLDMLRWKWNRYVVQFSSDDQRSAAVNIEGRLTTAANGFRGRLKGFARAAGSTNTYVLALMLLSAVTLLMALRLKSAQALDGAGSTVPGYYAEMLRILARRGLTRAPSETPLEFAMRSGVPGSRFVTEVFQKERYAGHAPDYDERERVRATVEELKAWKQDDAGDEARG